MLLSMLPLQALVSKLAAPTLLANNAAKKLLKDPFLEVLHAVGRNSRKPTKANHGARPNSHYMRKLKTKKLRRSTKVKD